MDNKISILSTAAIAESLVNKVQAAGMDIDVVPFISIEFLKDVPAIKECALKKMTAVFTSSNAVEAVAKQIEGAEDLKIWCVGNNSSDLIKKHFGDKLAGTAANAKDLARAILNDTETKEVTFFCGNIRRGELPDLLRQNGIMVNEVVVYNTTLSPVKTDKRYDAILFYSPSGVESFFSVNIISENTVLFTIGDTTASILKEKATNTIIVSEQPGKELLINKLTEYYTIAKQTTA